ncbi:PilC/PilY family type IV pilus protein [Geomonas paludis]|uniref:PilC/PilY family type IV pilus protein n=1 Tax=Geomonas paludis TaxID=2740185 RepID=A0A6V8MYG5_9BACT|nr:PilC/PilY family type IV pilus protein [Geomonas paludis]UPU34257.1 PilC/PilY family type IV pilus protein [Geomonas paludis]GFO64239.1 hypothetical protein GMPD_21580 [Geomonas paludis]
MNRLPYTTLGAPVLMLLLLLLACAGDAFGTTRSFGAGSYILASDSCWQPNNDTATVTRANYCDPNKNDKSLFQMFGMLYALLDTGQRSGQCVNNDGSAPLQKMLFGYCKQIRVYWIIDDGKKDPNAPDLKLTDNSATAASPMVTIYNSTREGTVAPISNYVTKADSGAATSISYAGGPFVIDVNDLTAAEFEIVRAKFPSVKLHRANIPFTGNVDKVLIGKPPKIAVLNEGASEVLDSYIRAAGASAWTKAMFQHVGARDILAGCLDDPVPSSCTARQPDITAPFQLLWAPHWLVSDNWEGGRPTVAEQQAVIRKIRNFLERGNSGLFECASIESMEGSASGGVSVGSAGGFTIGADVALPRIETNGGCSDGSKCSAGYFKYELPSFWLTQCGGWSFKATGGHVHNFRPSLVKSYHYLSTELADDPGTTADERYVGGQLTRFIHDDANKLSGAYDAGKGSAANYFLYDYLVGGRINGSPTQGYVVYLPGHSFINCSSDGDSGFPPWRTLQFQFNSYLPAGSPIYLEVVHSGCTQGLTCPKVSYDPATGTGTRAKNGSLELSAEFATFDPASNRLTGVTCASVNPNATDDVRITDFFVTFDGDLGRVKLSNIADLTVPDRQSLCTPNQTSSLSPVVAARCSTTTPASSLTLTFQGNVTAGGNKTVSVTVPFVSSQVSASYDIALQTGTVASSGNLTLDLRSAVYDGKANTLSGIILKRGGSCANVTLTDIQVVFPGSGTLTAVYNDTTSETVCTPNHSSPATCSGVIPPAPPAGWSYLLGKGICSYYVSPYLSSCSINWGSSNTCGIKYVLNTILALKYQLGSSSEYTKTQPIVQDNILYRASYDYPGYRGHLRMVKVPTDSREEAVTVWDAAGAMPPAGATGFPAAPLGATDTTSPRYIFTNLPGSATRVLFDPDSFARLDSSTKAILKAQLGAGSDTEAAITINTVRGRTGASSGGTSSCSGATGCGEDPKRLWAIENSTPALKVKSKYVEATAPAVTSAAIAAGKDRRDRVVFAGADDGMLHAFWAGSFDPETGGYPDTKAGNGSGKEIWAFLPSTMLAQLKNQSYADPANQSSFEPKVAVDGSPALSDFLICTRAGSTTGSCGKWEWKTRLVGTAMVRSQNRGIVFALDVTDPYAPQLLWENTYDVAGDKSCSDSSRNCNMGTSKGVAIGSVQVGKEIRNFVFLTSSWIDRKKPASSNPGETLYKVCAPDDSSGACAYGLSAYALDLDTGNVVWERSLAYTGDAAGINETPAVPALMDRDNNGSYDYLVFGDMQGRVWALRTTDGKAIQPVWELSNQNGVATGAKEPIGAPVSVYRDYIVLASGGADFPSNGSPTDATVNRIEIIKIGATETVAVQKVALAGYDGASGKGKEKVWAKPAITGDLKVYVATARSYFNSQTVSTLQSDGRIVVIDLKVQPDGAQGINNVMFIGGGGYWQSGGYVGGFDFDRKHAYITPLKASEEGSILQIGSKTDFSASKNKSNNYKVLWWRKM